MLPLLSPHPPPTQSTRKVLYAPHYCPSQQSCVCVLVCERERERESLHASEIRCLGRTRAWTYSQERLWMASFNRIPPLIGDNEDRQRRDTCHSLSSHMFDLRKFKFSLLLYYLISIWWLYFNQPIRHILMPFTSPLQMPVTFRLCEAAKHQ